MNSSILEKTAVELADLLDNKEIRSVEITRAFLDQIHRIDKQVHAFLHLDEEDFLTQAKYSDEKAQRGKLLGPLDGIP